MNSDIAQRTHSRPPSWARAPARSPRVIPSPGLRATVTALILARAVLTIISGVIHLYLWGETNGYRQIATIGPLFLVQGISALVIGLATAALRWLAAVLAAAGLLAGTAAGLLVTIEAGLFGFQGKLGRPVRPHIVLRGDCRAGAAAHRGLVPRGTQSRPALSH